jgi:hypothetical protein
MRAKKTWSTSPLKVMLIERSSFLFILEVSILVGILTLRTGMSVSMIMIIAKAEPDLLLLSCEAAVNVNSKEL